MGLGVLCLSYPLPPTDTLSFRHPLPTRTAADEPQRKISARYTQHVVETRLALPCRACGDFLNDQRTACFVEAFGIQLLGSVCAVRAVRRTCDVQR